MKPLKQEFEYWNHPFECLFKKFVCIMANYKSVDTVVALCGAILMHVLNQIIRVVFRFVGSNPKFIIITIFPFS